MGTFSYSVAFFVQTNYSTISFTASGYHKIKKKYIYLPYTITCGCMHMNEIALHCIPSKVAHYQAIQLSPLESELLHRVL